MLRLLASSILVLLGFECIYPMQFGIDKTCLTQPNDSTGVYAIQYNILTYNLTGLLIYKKLNDSTYRAIITSEMGPKILDIILYQDDYKLNFAIKQLKRKVVIKSFYNDLVSITGLNSRHAASNTSVTDSMVTINYTLSKKNNLIYSNNLINTISNATYIVKGEKKFTIHYFYGQKNTQVDSIFLKHWDYKMDMELRKIKF